ncbi:MAG: hypothetical protein ACXVKA_03040 [Acidimicrobiia bacterium]
MTDKSAFTDDEWHALTDAPLLVTLAIFATGEHGPISMVKEAAASARAIAHPGEHGPANDLIAEIAAAAETKDARHDMKEHRGRSMDEALQHSLTDLAPAAAALKKLPPDEAAQVGTWFVDIAKAIAEAAKTVNPAEQAAIDQITALFAPPV